MHLGRRKPREMADLLDDRGFPLQVGRLIGAAEMCAHWLTLQDDAQTKQMGERLGRTVDWFFEPSVTMTRGDERVTFVDPPPRT